MTCVDCAAAIGPRSTRCMACAARVAVKHCSGCRSTEHNRQRCPYWQRLMPAVAS